RRLNRPLPQPAANAAAAERAAAATPRQGARAGDNQPRLPEHSQFLPLRRLKTKRAGRVRPPLSRPGRSRRNAPSSKKKANAQLQRLSVAAAADRAAADGRLPTAPIESFSSSMAALSRRSLSG